MEAAEVAPHPAPGFSEENRSATQAVHKPCNSLQNHELEVAPPVQPKQNANTSEHKQHTSVREKCAIVCWNPETIPEDLAQVIAAWDDLSEKAKREILNLVQAARRPRR